MPAPLLLYPLTVVALDCHHLGELRRDGLQGDTHRHGVPRGLHPFVCLSRLLAHGAAAVVARQFPEAVPVYCVAAGELVGGVAAGEKVFLADGAVGHVLANLAVVVSEELLVDAHSAVLAMSEVLPAADAAEAAVGAVVWTLLVRHPEVAYGAVIFSELDVTVHTEVAVIIETREMGWVREHVRCTVPHFPKILGRQYEANT